MQRTVLTVLATRHVSYRTAVPVRVVTVTPRCSNNDGQVVLSSTANHSIRIMG